MKKIYLIAIIFLMSLGVTHAADITLTGTTTAASSADITFKAQNETISSYVNSVELNYEESTIPAGVTPNVPQVINYFQNGSQVFTFKTQAFLPNGATGSATVTFAFNVYVQGVGNPLVIKKTVTITPATAPPGNTISITVGNSPVLSGSQLFFTTFGETSANHATSVAINYTKSNIPPYIHMNNPIINTGWSASQPHTGFYTVGTFMGEAPASVTFNFAVDVKLSGGSTQTVTAAITIKQPEVPITGNTIVLQDGSNFMQTTVTGTEVSTSLTPTYVWEVSNDGGTNYRTAIVNPNDPLKKADFDQASNTSAIHSAALLPFAGTVIIRRKVTAGASVSYSNTVTIIAPTYSGPNRTVTFGPGETNANGYFIPNTTVHLTIQDPVPGVTYQWYFSTLQHFRSPVFDYYTPVATTSYGSGTSMQIQTTMPDPSGGGMILIRGSDGSSQIIASNTFRIFL